MELMTAASVLSGLRDWVGKISRAVNRLEINQQKLELRVIALEEKLLHAEVEAEVEQFAFVEDDDVFKPLPES